MSATTPSDGSRPAFYESLPLAALLFAFWLLLSGKLDAFHVGAGVASALGIAYASCYLYAVAPSIGPKGHHPFAALPWLRIAIYLPWLSWQIVLAAFQIARIVMSPKLVIEPKLFRFTAPLPHNLARATLANSITLTPGTVTIDVQGDTYLVHGLTVEASEELVSTEPKSMQARVGAVFHRNS